MIYCCLSSKREHTIFFSYILLYDTRISCRRKIFLDIHLESAHADKSTRRPVFLGIHWQILLFRVEKILSIEHSPRHSGITQLFTDKRIIEIGRAVPEYTPLQTNFTYLSYNSNSINIDNIKYFIILNSSCSTCHFRIEMRYEFDFKYT